MKLNPFENLYIKLMALYGPRGWWPLMDYARQPDPFLIPVKGYHPLDYSLPNNDDQRYEICIGAILTQNTTFDSVVTALQTIRRVGPITPEVLMGFSDVALKQAIRPVGYFNQKADYLRSFTLWFLNRNPKIPTRNALLNLRGIGPETADSMLLYAWKQPQMVVDAYTQRFLFSLKLFPEKSGYSNVKSAIEQAFFQSKTADKVIVFQEFHALMVEHGKSFYSRRPYGINDPLIAANENVKNADELHFTAKW
ncbi:MAG: endonuclease III domain-containing protein [Sphingobacteriia bacterium]|nr:endonuclease III domain-containing protein [Sphingobacteriia bacterium]